MFRNTKMVSIVAVALMLIIAGGTGFAQEISMWKTEISQPAKQVEITHWRASDPYWDATQERIIAEFEKLYPNIKVIWQTFPNVDYLPKFATSVAGGVEPEIVEMDSAYIAEYAANGAIVALTEYISPEYIDDLIPGAKDSVMFKGDIYGFPNEATNLEFVYNKDLLEKAGLKAPETWTEFIDAGEKVTIRGPDENVTQWGFVRASGTGGWDMHVTWQIFWSNSATILDEEGNPAVTSPSFLQAVNFINDIYNKYKIAPLAQTPTFDFPFGNVAMMQQGCWVVGSWARDYPELNYGVMKFPEPVDYGHVDPQHGVYGGWIPCVSQGFLRADQDTKNAVLLWLDYNGSNDTALTFLKEYGTLPPRTSAYPLIEKEKLSSQLNMFLELMKKYSRSRLVHPRYVGITRTLMEGIQKVLYTEVSAQEAMEEVAKIIEQKYLA